MTSSVYGVSFRGGESVVKFIAVTVAELRDYGENRSIVCLHLRMVRYVNYIPVNLLLNIYKNELFLTTKFVCSIFEYLGKMSSCQFLRRE